MENKREPVEKFKLTKDQLAWTKEYKRLKKANEMVKGKLMEQMAGARQLKDLLGTTQQGLIRMLQVAPKKKLNEIEGQE